MSEYVAGPDGVGIRPAARADLLAIVRIENDAFPQPWPYDAFEWFLGEPAFLVAVDARGDGVDATDRIDGIDWADAVDGGDGGPGDPIGTGGVVGYLVADVAPTHGRTLGHVKDLAVRADRRGAGVGSALLARALSVLASRGADSVKLEVRASNDGAKGLYRSFGFEALRRVPGYYENDEDAVVMIRSLGG